MGLFSPLTGIMGQIFGADVAAEDEAARQATKGATQEYQKIALPDLAAPEYAQFSDQGGYAPEIVGAPEAVNYSLADPAMATAVAQGPSAMGDISTDPRLRDSQYSSLNALDEIVRGGGLGAQDKADLARIQSETAQADRGRREAILQNLGARGMAGSGQELLAQLTSSQGASDRAAQQGLDVAGMAQQRALQAIMNQGQMAGQMQGQEFGQQSEVAQAKDAIERFNAANAQAVALANPAAINAAAVDRAHGKLQADQFTVGQTQAARAINAAAGTQAHKEDAIRRQDLANKNVGLVNLSKDAAAGLPQQQFQNRLQKAGGVAGGLRGEGALAQSEADRKSREHAEYLSTILEGTKKVASAAGGPGAAAGASGALPPVGAH